MGVWSHTIQTCALRHLPQMFVFASVYDILVSRNRQTVKPQLTDTSYRVEFRLDDALRVSVRAVQRPLSRCVASLECRRLMVKPRTRSMAGLDWMLRGIYYQLVISRETIVAS